MTDEARLTVVVDRKLHRKAKVKAAVTGKPMAEVMREALQRWVEEDELSEEEKRSKKP
jgi:predicted HicB family RNase H-like nuclease